MLRAIFNILILLQLKVFTTPKALAAPGATPTPSCDPGVLTSQVCPGESFSQYINRFLSENLDTILFIAMVMIAYSGVQYMSSGFSADAQKIAKQRIMGIIGGVIFYLLLTAIVSMVTANLASP